MLRAIEGPPVSAVWAYLLLYLCIEMCNREKSSLPGMPFSYDSWSGRSPRFAQNYKLADISAKVAERSRKSTLEPRCTTHKEKLSVFCSKCDTVICAECLNSTHEGHQVGNLNKQFDVAQSRLKKVIGRAEEISNNISEDTHSHHQALNTIEECHKQVLETVNNQLTAIQTSFDRAKSEIRLNIKKKMENEKKRFAEGTRLLDQRYKEVQSDIEICKTLLQKSKVQVLKEYTEKMIRIESKLNAAKRMGMNPQLDMPSISGSLNCSWMQDATEHLKFYWDNDTLTEWEKIQKDMPTILGLIERYKGVNMSGNKALVDKGKQLERDLQKKDAICAAKELEILQLKDDVWTAKKTKGHEKIDQRVKELTKQVHDQEAQIYKLGKDNEHSARRLSPVAGAQLTQGNPNIADLSDHRPTKIAERLSELYDNEWTDAFEVLLQQMNLNEGRAIGLLLEILQDGYQFCRDHYMVYTSKLTKDLVMISGEENPSKKSDKPMLLSEAKLKSLKDLLRSFGPDTVPVVKQLFRSEMKKQKKDKIQTMVDAFTNKCIELCWFMAIQDPPLFLDFNTKQGDKLDSSKLRLYSKSGTVVEFLVWPALFLFENGSLLTKGIAEVKPTKK